MPLDVERVYAQSGADPGFAAVLQAGGLTAQSNDEALAEAIETDGRWRLRRGRNVTLERYLHAITDLPRRPDALDAALEVTLRGMSGSSRIAPEAIESLSAHHPALATAIREAAALNAALWSTTGLQNRVAPRPAKGLPCDFGPKLPTGQRRYRLLELLGQGSFGQVYRAEDRQLSEEGHAAVVAIKVLSSAEQSEHDRHRMIDEATKARRISHSNVVQVLDRGATDDGEDFIVYEFVGGGDLGDARAGTLSMTTQRAASIMAQIARGVHAAHAAGVIHCDLKPSNIMLTSDGRPKVADFGIAVRVGEDRRAALAGRAYGRGPIGNIAFISPEQYRSEERGFSVPSDVYALGGLLFHLLTGQLPNGATREDIARTHDEKSGRPVAPSPHQHAPGIDRDLDAICRRALSPQPADRQTSAAALAEDLERWLRLEPIGWLHPSTFRKMSLWVRRKPALAIATSGILVLAVTGILVASHFAREANRKALEAERNSTAAQVAQAKVEGDAKIRRIQEIFKSNVFARLTTLGKDQSFLTDMLMQVWIYEYMYGPMALGQPDVVEELWDKRKAGLREVFAQRHARGLDDTLETLLWNEALAFWLVSDHDHAEAIPLLESAVPMARGLLKPTDPWLDEMATLRLCAQVNQACDMNSAPADAASRIAALTELEQSLVAAAGRIEQSHPRSPIHYLVLNRLADLNDPPALDQPARAEEFRAQVKRLLNATQTQATGVVQDAQKAKAATQPHQP